ncbi:unnamed protein product [Caenorhabditis bovis]|uniref:Uncharacterized protein n=1 Tax=Caenorhabditis bovis TaxID=2654633 RepID=A0A8S1F6T1_9PELO|nr:unnamed protein product [Caenorhabditis bovis]
MNVEKIVTTARLDSRTEVFIDRDDVNPFFEQFSITPPAAGTLTPPPPDYQHMMIVSGMGRPKSMESATIDANRRADEPNASHRSEARETAESRPATNPTDRQHRVRAVEIKIEEFELAKASNEARLAVDDDRILSANVVESFRGDGDESVVVPIPIRPKKAAVRASSPKKPLIRENDANASTSNGVRCVEDELLIGREKPVEFWLAIENGNEPIEDNNIGLIDEQDPLLSLAIEESLKDQRRRNEGEASRGSEQRDVDEPEGNHTNSLSRDSEQGNIEENEGNALNGHNQVSRDSEQHDIEENEGNPSNCQNHMNADAPVDPLMRDDGPMAESAQSPDIEVVFEEKLDDCIELDVALLLQQRRQGFSGVRSAGGDERTAIRRYCNVQFYREPSPQSPESTSMSDRDAPIAVEMIEVVDEEARRSQNLETPGNERIADREATVDRTSDAVEEEAQPSCCRNLKTPEPASVELAEYIDDNKVVEGEARRNQREPEPEQIADEEVSVESIGEGALPIEDDEEEAGACSPRNLETSKGIDDREPSVGSMDNENLATDVVDEEARRLQNLETLENERIADREATVDRTNDAVEEEAQPSCCWNLKTPEPEPDSVELAECNGDDEVVEREARRNQRAPEPEQIPDEEVSVESIGEGVSPIRVNEEEAGACSPRNLETSKGIGDREPSVGSMDDEDRATDAVEEETQQSRCRNLKTSEPEPAELAECIGDDEVVEDEARRSLVEGEAAAEQSELIDDEVRSNEGVGEEAARTPEPEEDISVESIGEGVSPIEDDEEEAGASDGSALSQPSEIACDESEDGENTTIHEVDESLEPETFSLYFAYRQRNSFDFSEALNLLGPPFNIIRPFQREIRKILDENCVERDRLAAYLKSLMGKEKCFYLTDHQRDFYEPIADNIIFSNGEWKFAFRDEIFRNYTKGSSFGTFKTRNSDGVEQPSTSQSAQTSIETTDRASSRAQNPAAETSSDHRATSSARESTLTSSKDQITRDNTSCHQENSEGSDSSLLPAQRRLRSVGRPETSNNRTEFKLRSTGHVATPPPLRLRMNRPKKKESPTRSPIAPTTTPQRMLAIVENADVSPLRSRRNADRTVELDRESTPRKRTRSAMLEAASNEQSAATSTPRKRTRPMIRGTEEGEASSNVARQSSVLAYRYVPIDESVQDRRRDETPSTDLSADPSNSTLAPSSLPPDDDDPPPQVPQTRRSRSTERDESVTPSRRRTRSSTQVYHKTASSSSSSSSSSSRAPPSPSSRRRARWRNRDSASITPPAMTWSSNSEMVSTTPSRPPLPPAYDPAYAYRTPPINDPIHDRPLSRIETPSPDLSPTRRTRSSHDAVSTPSRPPLPPAYDPAYASRAPPIDDPPPTSPISRPIAPTTPIRWTRHVEMVRAHDFFFNFLTRRLVIFRFGRRRDDPLKALNTIENRLVGIREAGWSHDDYAQRKFFVGTISVDHSTNSEEASAIDGCEREGVIDVVDCRDATGEANTIAFKIGDSIGR